MEYHGNPVNAQNLTRYKVTLEDQGSLVVVYRGFCEVTGFPVDYLSAQQGNYKKKWTRENIKRLFSHNKIRWDETTQDKEIKKILFLVINNHCFKMTNYH